jgi:hypothetical protein
MHLLLGILILIALAHAVDYDQFVRDRLAEVRAARFQNNQAYWPQDSYPPQQWDQQKGLFASYVHVNFHGKSPISDLRGLYKFPDNNGFVTMFVLQAMIEAAELNSDIEVGDDEIVESLEALKTHMDKNHPAGSPIVSFWNQKINAKGNYYKSFPENIAIPISRGMSGTDMLIKFANSIGMGYLAPVLELLGDTFSRVLREVSIPSDFDDTGCNLALGMKLKNLNSKYESASRLWSENNQDLGYLFKMLKKYHYDPSSPDVDHSTIDPRTYFWIRNFVEKKSA